jgi:CBS domain-containing protein
MDARTLLTPIEQIRYRPATCIKPGMTALEAARLMQTNRVGCLLVVNDHRQLIGILTDRDFLRLAARGRQSLEGAHVEDFMTGEPEYLHCGDPLAFAVNLMAVGRFRHVPLVAGDNREPVGYISSADIVRFLAKSIESTMATSETSPSENTARRTP